MSAAVVICANAGTASAQAIQPNQDSLFQNEG